MKRLFSIFFCILLFSAFSVVGFAVRSFPQIVGDCFTYNSDNGGSFILNENHRPVLASASADVQDFYFRLENNPSDFLVSYMSWYNGDFYTLTIADVSSVPSHSVVCSSSSFKFTSAVPYLIYNVSAGGSRLPLTYGSTSSVDFTFGQVVSGSYLNKSIFSSIPPNLFDTSMPVARFSTDGVLADKHTLSIDYQYPDGTTAAPSHTSRIEFEKEYSVSSPSVVGHTPDHTVISGSMPNENLNLTVTYSPTPYQLSVNFVNDKGSQVAPPATQTLFYNDTYSVACPSVVGYTPERESVAGVMPPNDFVDTVLYNTNSYTLTINYLDSNGNAVSPSNVSSVKYGDGYNITSPIVDGLEADTLSVLGTMPPNDYTVNVVYGKPMSAYDKMLSDSLNNLLSLSSINLYVICGVGICLLAVLVTIVFMIRLLNRLFSYLKPYN